MVSSGEVGNVSSESYDLFSNFGTTIGDVEGKWEGESHDNFVTQAEFYTDYSSKLESQLNSFANACDAFKTYKEQKEYIAKLEEEMNSFSEDVDTSDYEKNIKDATEAMNEAKAQIESALSTASGIKLEASKGSIPSGSAAADGKSANSKSGSVVGGGLTVGFTAPTNARMQAVVDQAKANAPGVRGGECEKWAEIVWEQATGIQRDNQIGAYQAWCNFGVSDSRDNIPVGAMVYGSGVGADGAEYGHVGIYAGDGIVVDEGGEETLDDWLSWQTANCHGKVGYLGWGWQNGIDLSKME